MLPQADMGQRVCRGGEKCRTLQFCVSKSQKSNKNTSWPMLLLFVVFPTCKMNASKNVFDKVIIIKRTGNIQPLLAFICDVISLCCTTICWPNPGLHTLHNNIRLLFIKILRLWRLLRVTFPKMLFHEIIWFKKKKKTFLEIKLKGYRNTKPIIQ